MGLNPSLSSPWLHKAHIGINRPKPPMEETRDSDVMFTWNEKGVGGGNVGLSWCLLYTSAFLTDKQFHICLSNAFPTKGSAESLWPYCRLNTVCQDTDSKPKGAYMSFLVCRVSLSLPAIIYLPFPSASPPICFLSSPPVLQVLFPSIGQKSDLVSVYLVYLKRISGTQRKALSQEITTDSWHGKDKLKGTAVSIL